MTWVVLKFIETNEVEVVPTFWYDREHQMCIYPPYPKTRLEKAIRQQMPVPSDPIEEGWINYSAKIMSKEYDNFVTASAKAAKACFTSDISEAEIENLPEKRSRRKKMLSSSESDSGRDTPDEPSLMNVPKMCLTKASKPAGLPRDQSSASQSISSKSSISQLSVESYYVKPKSVQVLSNSCVIPPTEVPPGNGDDVQKVVIKYLVMNKSLLEGLEKKLSQLITTVNNMEKVVNSINKASDQTPIAALELQGNTILSSIPVNSEEEVQKFKEIVTDAEMLQTLVKKLAHIGGNSYKECIRRYLAKLISDNVARGYTLHGHRDGKRSFIESPFFKIIMDAVQISFPDASHKNIELQIGIWLTKAPERIREKCKKEQRNNNGV